MSLVVKHLDRAMFEVTCRGHSIITDQPEPVGTDQGMTPVELFIASLSACAAHYAQLFLKRRIRDLKGLEIISTWQFLENPHRVGAITLTIVPPRSLTEQEKTGLLKSIEQCTIENTLKHQAEIKIDIKG